MQRIRIPTAIVAVATVAAAYAWAVVAATPAYPGKIGINLNALGTDWMVFFGGAHWFFDGNLSGLYDGDRFTDHLNATFVDYLSEPLPFRPWVYPPTYLLLMLPFGALPFLASYAAFQLVSAGLLSAALWFGTDRTNVRHLVLAAALLGPAAAINVGMGQNAFLSAALLVGGFRAVRTHPALGGIILGVLTIKPQFYLLVPVALVAAREWRALAWSILAAAALAFVSFAVFGIDLWRHWLDLALASYADPQGKWGELGRMWGGSVYACAISAGASQTVANIAQAIGTLLGIGLAYRVFRVPSAGDRRIAVLLAATILAAPHSSLADTVLLAAAAALWGSEAAQTDAPLMRWNVALAVWLASQFYPPIMSPLARLLPLLILGFIAMTLTGAGRAAASAPAPHPTPGRLHKN